MILFPCRNIGLYLKSISSRSFPHITVSPLSAITSFSTATLINTHLSFSSFFSMADYSRYSQASPIGSQWLHENAPSQPAWAHAYLRPRLTRIMKPRSAGNSPSSTGRNRTRVAQSVMHAPSNQYQASLEAALLASAVRNPRPISWHPSSARGRGLSNPSCLPGFVPNDYSMGTLSSQSTNALPVYGDDTMLPDPTSAGPSYSPGYYPVYSDMQDAMSLPQQTPMSMCGSQGEPINWDIAASNADPSTVTQTTSDGWSLDMLSMANIPPAETACPSYASVPSPGELSGPSTPDFLPIQQFDDDELNPQPKKDGKAEKELVGMGLYSRPDGSLGHRYQGTLGKGLKLEETFSPDAEQDDASADASENGNDAEPVQQQSGHDDYASMTQQPTFSLPKQPSKQALNLLHKSFFFDSDVLDQQATTAAQPFANLNQSCMSYGYGWI